MSDRRKRQSMCNDEISPQIATSVIILIQR
jgi:hypothetical protein